MGAHSTIQVVKKEGAEIDPSEHVFQKIFDNQNLVNAVKGRLDQLTTAKQDVARDHEYGENYNRVVDYLKENDGQITIQKDSSLLGIKFKADCDVILVDDQGRPDPVNGKNIYFSGGEMLTELAPYPMNGFINGSGQLGISKSELIGLRIASAETPKFENSNKTMAAKENSGIAQNNTEQKTSHDSSSNIKTEKGYTKEEMDETELALNDANAQDQSSTNAANDQVSIS